MLPGHMMCWDATLPCGTIPRMKRQRLLIALLLLLPVLLSGCSVAGIDLSFNSAASHTSTTAATAVPAERYCRRRADTGFRHASRQLP